MRQLTLSEISALQSRQCSSDNWENIQVADDFSAEYINNVRFSGEIYLGTFNKIFELPSGIKKHSGIYNAVLHNCVVENDVFINNVNNHIANYHIKNNCYIENIDSLAVEEKSTFGNGVRVNVLNEAGGREVKIFNGLSSHLAYILALYRHRTFLIERIDNLIDKYVESKTSNIGVIGSNTRIINCGKIKNVEIENFAFLENVSALENGTVCSDEVDKTYIGNGVIACDFIIGKGSGIFDGAIIEKCFIGESCEVGKQYSAVDSLFFCNSQLLHGEAAAVFGGPFTTTHHKSTLLIGCMFSFFNAGSGTNQSNHMYKLGPIHQGILERGAKTGSDSYLMLEAKIGAFSLVLGHHESHFDTSDLPFSYILADGNKSMLIPAVNFLTVGSQRDAMKWPKRDNRKGREKSDYIIFDLLNPYIIQKIKRGIDVLESLKQKSSDISFYKNIRIKEVFLSRGIQIYRSAIVCYLGKKLIEKLSSSTFDKENLRPKTKFGKSDWIDLSGLIVPQDLLEAHLQEIENGQYKSLDAINAYFSNVYDDYSYYEWNYICHLLCEYSGKSFDEISENDIVSLLESYKKELTFLTDSIISDAGKEFGTVSMVSFGAAGDKEVQQADFENVRGTLEDNSFVKEILKAKEEELMKIERILSR